MNKKNLLKSAIVKRMKLWKQWDQKKVANKESKLILKKIK